MVKEKISQIVDDWVNHDCPLGGKDAINQAMRDLLVERLMDIDKPDKPDLKPPVLPDKPDLKPPDYIKPPDKPILPRPKR